MQWPAHLHYPSLPRYDISSTKSPISTGVEHGDNTMAGCFSKRLENPQLCTFADWANPWNFYQLLLQPNEKVFEWLRKNRLLWSGGVCPCCGGEVRLNQRKRFRDGVSWRCTNNRAHEVSIRENSFFARSHFDVRDLLQFTKDFLDGHSLRTCARFGGLDYKKTSVDWANLVRDIFRQYIGDELPGLTFSGEVEVDESLFGRKCKYNRGNPAKGVQIWIFGLVERASNRIILYPVENRKRETLLRVIQRHVAPGSTIFSDGWAAYTDLNDMGYTHFSVVHKKAFKTTYENPVTNEKIEVHTNTIEGAWKHAKDHFRKINGTSIQNFEAHLAEIVWRNHISRTSQTIYEAFFDLVSKHYPLDVGPRLNCPIPLFNTWQMNTGQHHRRSIVREDGDIDVDAEPVLEDADYSDEATNEGSAIDVATAAPERLHPNVTVRRQRTARHFSAEQPNSLLPLDDVDMHSPASLPGISPDRTASPTTACTPAVTPRHPVKPGPSKRRSSSENVCCPAGFEPVANRSNPGPGSSCSKTSGGVKKRKIKPPRQSAKTPRFSVSKPLDLSSDSDFV